MIPNFDVLSSCGCPEVYLDGSFITEKEKPRDYDLCYEPTGMSASEALSEFLTNRESRKNDYLGDIFPRMPQPPYEIDHVEEWQKDTTQDNVVKGILKINLGAEDDAQKRKTIQ